MVFSSINFLYYFLPLTLIIYFITPNKLKNLVLLFISLIFYAYGEPIYIILMIVSIVISYTFALLIEKTSNKKHQKLLLTLALIIHLGMLGYFKYLDFFITNINLLFTSNINLINIALPIGISFYTFQSISYIVDVYKNETKAIKNIITLATYIALFPQLVAGPIIKLKTIEKELKERKSTFNDISIGIRKFIIGLSKKVILANSLGLVIEIFLKYENKTFLFYWIYAICFTMQIYLDFSGYSDMAIGLGKMFGFNFPENFNYPFIAKSITDFWRKWHISLGSWFKEYLYIPLGGNKTSKLKWVRNILIVWMLTGLWHGASWNFIIWGLFFAIILLIEKVFLIKYLKKIPEIITRFYVLIIIIISFIIFNATDLNMLIMDLFSLFGINNLPFSDNITFYYLKSSLVLIIISIIATTPFMKNIIIKMKTNNKINKFINIMEPIFLLILLIISTAYLVDSTFNPFIYFRF